MYLWLASKCMFKLEKIEKSKLHHKERVEWHPPFTNTRKLLLFVLLDHLTWQCLEFDSILHVFCSWAKLPILTICTNNSETAVTSSEGSNGYTLLHIKEDTMMHISVSEQLMMQRATSRFRQHIKASSSSWVNLWNGTEGVCVSYSERRQATWTVFEDKPCYHRVPTEVDCTIHWHGVKVRSCVKGKMDSQAPINLMAEIDGAAHVNPFLRLQPPNQHSRTADTLCQGFSFHHVVFLRAEPWKL